MIQHPLRIVRLSSTAQGEVKWKFIVCLPPEVGFPLITKLEKKKPRHRNPIKTKRIRCTNWNSTLVVLYQSGSSIFPGASGVGLRTVEIFIRFQYLLVFISSWIVTCWMDATAYWRWMQIFMNLSINNLPKKQYINTTMRVHTVCTQWEIFIILFSGMHL